MAHARLPFHRHCHRRLLPIVVVAAALCAPPGVAGAQRPKTGPNVKSQVEVLDEEYGTHLRLLERYRIDDDGALRDLMSFWTRLYKTDRETISVLIEQLPAGIAPLAEMALTDLALDAFTRGDTKLAGMYLETAERWINQVLKTGNTAARDRQLRFARDWYVAIIWLRFARFERQRLPSILERARARFPDDPDVLLSSGTYEELELTRARVERQIDRRESQARKDMIDISRRTLLATDYYRQAIVRDPNAAEARIRLAYVLMSVGDREREEALALLQEARTLVSQPPLGYLAALFAGAIEEQRKQLPAASLWYRTAIAACPRAQTARLAYSHLLLDQEDNTRSAQNTLRPLMGGPSRDDGVCEPDPWRMYEFGQAWRLNALIGAMRKQVRESTEKSEPEPEP
jgi:tetratricopeptide (TPR) repeat protein